MPIGIPRLRIPDIFINARSFVDQALVEYVDADTVPDWFEFEESEGSAPGGVKDIEVSGSEITFNREGVYSASIEAHLSKAGVNPETIWLVIEYSIDGGANWLRYPYSRRTGMDITGGTAAIAAGRFAITKDMKFRAGAVSTDGVSATADLTSITGVSFVSVVLTAQKVADL